jgi:L-arabinose transport system substrate-binding protein
MLLGGCSKRQSTGSEGSTAESNPTGKFRIGFLVKRPEESWFQQEWKSAQRAADENGFELIKIGVPDGEKLLAAIDNLAAMQAGGFVVCTPDVRLGPAIVARATAQHMKVFAVDDQFIGADGQPMAAVPFMGMAAPEIGRQVGQALAAEMKQRGCRVEETGAAQITFDELATCQERTGGAVAALVAAGFPKAQIYPAAQTTTDVPGAFDAANVLLTQHAAVKHWLVFGCNDEAVLGTVRALEGRGFGVADVIGIGIGGDTVLTDLHKEKPTGVVGSILCSSRRHGYETATLMYHWIKDGKEPPRTTFTAGTLLTRENFRQVIQELDQPHPAPTAK